MLGVVERSTPPKFEVSVVSMSPPVPRLLDYEAVPQEVVDQLQQIPWAARLIDDPHIMSISSRNRIVKADKEDSMMASTLATESTFPVWRIFYQAPPPTQPQQRFGFFYFLMRVGDGLNGHPVYVHGGAISLIFDEVLSSTAITYQSEYHTGFTVEMTVKYRKTVPAPGWLLCRSWVERVDFRNPNKRKMWLKAVLEDGMGQVYAESEGFFLGVERSAVAPKL